MAINQEQVNEVCNSIAAAGDTPTLIKVRDALGSGSMATIARMVREWKGSSDQTEAATASTLPESIHALAVKLWAEAQKQAAMQYEAQRVAMAAQLAEAEQALETAYAEWSRERENLKHEIEHKAQHLEGTKNILNTKTNEFEKVLRELHVSKQMAEAERQTSKRYEDLLTQMISKLEPQKPAPTAKTTETPERKGTDESAPVDTMTKPPAI